MRLRAASSMAAQAGRLLGASVAAVVVGASLGGCGGAHARSSGTTGGEAALVNGASIASATVKHWMSVLAPQHVVPEPPNYVACIRRMRSIGSATSAELRESCREQRAELLERALDLIISSGWLVSEAASRGVPVTAAEVRGGVAAHRSAFPGGKSEFGEALHATAHTLADLELEIRSELAAKNLRGAVLAGATPVSSAGLHAYYRRHLAHYRVPARRTIDIVENLKSEREAKLIIERIRRGASIAALGIPDESFYRSEIAETAGEKRKILEAIFAATPHTVAPVVELNNLYFVFEVTRVAPAHETPFARVQREIARRLGGQRSRRALARFIDIWRREWIAQTSCAPGYVVAACRQYHGSNVVEPPPMLL